MWRRSAPADGHATPRTTSPPPPPALLRRMAFAGALALPLAAWLLRRHGAPELGNALSVLLIAAALTILTRAFGVRVTLALSAGVLTLVGCAAALGLPPVYWPPVVMNLAMAAVFGVSLRHGEPLVTRFARLERTPVTPQIERYCRRLTAVWTAYLALLGLVGIAIAIHGDERIGAWWCGIVNYVLVAALFFAERLVRPVAVPAGVMEQTRNVLDVLRGPRA
jgi:uncharacterized membrane protein